MQLSREKVLGEKRRGLRAIFAFRGERDNRWSQRAQRRYSWRDRRRSRGE